VFAVFTTRVNRIKTMGGYRAMKYRKAASLNLFLHRRFISLERVRRVSYTKRANSNSNNVNKELGKGHWCSLRAAVRV
jgi:hypothetical protein